MENWKNEIFENGFVRLSGAVPEQKINTALRAINHSVGNGMNKKEMPGFRSLSFCPELRNTQPILDLLYETPIWDHAESAIGKGKVKPWGNGQIALRFPVMETPGQLHPHIDGMYSPGNKIQKGTFQTFTMLAGVFLSDVPNRFWGNFTVWPGTHRTLAEYFKTNGHEILRKSFPPIQLPEPHQITAAAGDAILCHYQLAHTVAINVSPFVRYAVFFRLRHVDHETHREKVFTDLWLEWPGLRADSQP